MKTLYEQINEIVDQSPGQEFYEVSPKIYSELMIEARMRQYYPMKPQPPVKRVKSSRGFFAYIDEVEYDHHAPEYLEALRRYEKDVQNYKDQHFYTKGYIEVHTSSHGVVKLKVAHEI